MDSQKTFLSQAEWCALPQEERNKLREVFGVTKSSQVRIQDNRLVSDGTEPGDLLNTLNLKAVLKFLGQEFKAGETYFFDVLFKEAHGLIFGVKTTAPVHAPAPVNVVVPAPVPVPVAKPKGRPRKPITISQKKNG